jgi:hypothetical protein
MRDWRKELSAGRKTAERPFFGILMVFDRFHVYNLHTYCAYFEKYIGAKRPPRVQFFRKTRSDGQNPTIPCLNLAGKDVKQILYLYSWE